jgi:hypothetical protein
VFEAYTILDSRVISEFKVERADTAVFVLDGAHINLV